MIHFTNTRRIGDLIVYTKGVFSTHFMVCVGFIGNVEMVAENQPGCGVRILPLKEALGNNKILRTEPFKGTEIQRASVFAHAQQLVGTAYDLIKFNCEHFARMISNGNIESMQVKNAAAVMGLVGVGFLAFAKNKKLKLAGVILLLLAFIISATQSSSVKAATA